MTSNTGNPFSQCICCTKCQDKAKDFQKVVDLKNIGLVIYRHMLEIEAIKIGPDEAAKVIEGTLIIENTKDQEITSAQYLPEIEQNKISCPRCRKIFEHAQRLLQTIPNLDKNVVHGICEHCIAAQKSCNECEQVIQKFKSKAKELPENTKNIIKQWLSKVKYVFKSIDLDYNIEDFKLDETRTSSDLHGDRLLIKSPKQPRERHVKHLFFPQTPSTQKTVTDDRIVCLEEGLAVGQPVAGTHLKENRLRVLESIPPVPISSKQKLLEDSLECTGSKESLTRPKSSHYKNITKPDDMDQLFGEANKRNLEHSLRKYHSDESLLTIAEVISKSGVKMRKDFSYFFPKKKKYVYPKRFASSSKLIKETRDILQEKAEAERKKREMKLLRKLNIEAKKKEAGAETKAYPGGKPKDKEKSGKEPHGREDGTFRHLTSPIGQRETTIIREERQSSSATMRGVNKRDDKSNKIQDIAPSKTADFEVDKGETTHIVKGERYAKGDTSKGKTGYAKNDRQKDIRENQKKTEKEKLKTENEEKGRQDKEQKHREKDEREKPNKEKVDERPPKEQRQRDKEGREQYGKVKADERTPKEQRQRDKEGREQSGRVKVDERPPKEQRQRDKEGREQSGKVIKVDERTPKEERQRNKEERKKLGKGKVDERPYKEQKQKEDKMKSPGLLREVEQISKGKTGEEKLNKIQKEKKETADKSTETPTKKKNQKNEKEIAKQDKEKDERADSKKDKEQQLKQYKEKDGKEKTTKEQEAEKMQRDAGEAKETKSANTQEALLGLGQENQKKEKETKQETEQTEKFTAERTTKQKVGKLHRKQEQKDIKKTTSKREEELSQETTKIERDARETKETISAKAQEALLGLSKDKQKKEKEHKEKYAAEPTIKQKVGKVHRDQEQKDKKDETSKSEEELPKDRKKIDRDARENKEIISAKAKEALLGHEKQLKEKETKQKIDKKETRESKSGSGKTASGKSKKLKRGKSPKKNLPREDETETRSDSDIAPISKYGKRNFKELDESEESGLAIDTIRVRRASPDDLILRLVRLKQMGLHQERPKAMVALKALDIKLRQQHNPHKSLNKKCIMCVQSDLEFDLDCLFYDKKAPKFEEIIIGSTIYKYTAPFLGETIKATEPSAVPLLFKSNFVQDEKIDSVTIMQPQSLLPPSEQAPKAEDGGGKKTGKPTKVTAPTELESSKGIIHYTLSDRSFIEKGWTMLPTEKVVRKINVYRMRPAQPEFDWFEHNKNKGQMTYDTGELLAEFDDNGRGRWFYRNGRLALDYYDAEELNASQRVVIWSSGEPDERGRTQPYTILATFDYLGNGIVFDHSGKIRLKYNQTEGIVLDRKIGPVSHWKWHTLNDPPVLQQVMIDTQMPHKDQNILKLGGAGDDKSRPDNDDMLAIEFDNFVREKTKKLTQSFKPFQIKMKALKINENFSLRVMDQASVYLIYRDGTTNLKLNIGMILDHKEIVDTDTAEVGEVSNNLERFPARTDSLAGLQKSVAYAQCFERMRSARERRLRNPPAVASADRMTAAASRPLRPPLRSIPSDSSTTVTRTGFSCSRKPTNTNIYYDNRLF